VEKVKFVHMSFLLGDEHEEGLHGFFSHFDFASHPRSVGPELLLDRSILLGPFFIRFRSPATHIRSKKKAVRRAANVTRRKKVERGLETGPVRKLERKRDFRRFFAHRHLETRGKKVGSLPTSGYEGSIEVARSARSRALAVLCTDTARCPPHGFRG
jgi:hypothetical protein